MRHLFLFILAYQSIQAQQDIYPNLLGEELITALIEDYKPSQLMDYGDARDSMYLNIYRDDQGNVTCYYTGFSVYLPDNVDPSAFLYDNESPIGITAEHIYPQSKGAGEGNAKSDMHSLVPCIWQANEARSNYPFEDVPDDETDRWFYLSENLADIPSADIDNYSELLNGGFGNVGAFEPRESVKGDIARAVFYFYTMYKEEANAADPDFFDSMKYTLINWHLADPVDETEYVRNYKKAYYQDGKLNPFILDCTLPTRTLGSFVGHCEGFTSAIDEPEFMSERDILVYPNPVGDYLNLKHVKYHKNECSLVIYDIRGTEIKAIDFLFWNQVDVSEFTAGYYYAVLSEKDKYIWKFKFLKN